MITKAFEIRDRGTFIPVLAVKMVPEDERGQEIEPERFLLARAGYNRDYTLCVVLCRMDANGSALCASYDPYSWGGRSFPVAHQYILAHFDELESGAVVDVEFILGETKQPKQSERETE